MTQIIYLGSPHITSSPLALPSDFSTIIKPYYKDNLVLDILALDLYDFLISIQRFKNSDYNSCVYINSRCGKQIKHNTLKYICFDFL